MNNQTYEIINQNDLISRTQKFYDEDYRLVQIGATKTAENIELNYSFDKNYQFVNLKILVAHTGNHVPSISHIYPNAFLYENEVHDLFGVNIQGISIDFKGTFYKTAVQFPFNKKEN